MELKELLLLYDRRPPASFRTQNTSHGEEDFRQAIFAEWTDRKLVIKVTCNDFTTPERIAGWQRTIEAYRNLGFYCPEILPSLSGRTAEQVEYENRACTVYAEEFSKYQTADQYGPEHYKTGSLYSYHRDAIRFLGIISSNHLTTADFPSGICIMERFCPSDPCDEIMSTALDFKKTIEEQFPSLQDRFQQIWDTFVENWDKLAQVYPLLPKSVFQADLNETNILLDETMRFVGTLDFNLCGYDTVLNCLFRESFTDFYEDIPWDNQKNAMYSEEANQKAFQSFLNNLYMFKEVYTFSQLEKETAILLYRYLRPFWWQPLLALSRCQGEIAKAEQILSWIEGEQNRPIDFQRILE